jgi:phosphopantetheinyl transferase (holo-ACP synthase)
MPALEKMNPRAAPSNPITLWLATPGAADLFEPEKLSAAQKTEWQSLRTERRRRDWAVSRALTAHTPDLSRCASSLSHSAAYAALAVAPHPLEVGVDIESIRPRAYLDMARIGFAEGEVDYLASVNDTAERGNVFYILWTLKEAFAKALTMNFLDALHHCAFIDSNRRWHAQVPTCRHWHATVFAPRPLLRLALVRVGEPQVIRDTPLETREWPQHLAEDWAVVMEFDSASGDMRKEC